MKKSRTSTRKAMLATYVATSSYSEAARLAGISRQRVQQLLRPKKKVRLEIWERAGGRCESCHESLPAKEHAYHHITYDWEHLNDPDNLLLLCLSCHSCRINNGAPKYIEGQWVTDSRGAARELNCSTASIRNWTESGALKSFTYHRHRWYPIDSLKRHRTRAQKIAERNTAMRDFKRHHPAASYEEIAERFGVSYGVAAQVIPTAG